MSLIHPNSCPSTKSELDIFSIPPTQVAIESGRDIRYYPINSISSSPSPNIQFDVPADANTYVDINESDLYLEVNIEAWKGAVGTAVDPATDGIVYSCENNIFGSIIAHTDLLVSDKLVTSSSQNQPYVSYIENLLGISREAKKTVLRTVGWLDEEAGRDLDTPSDKRYEMTPNGTTFALRGRLNLPLTNQQRQLISGVRLRFSFQVARQEFFLLVKTGFGVTVTVKKAVLTLRHTTLFPNIQIAHETALKTTPAKYPNKRANALSFTLPAGASSYTIDSIISGLLPTRIICGFVHNDAFVGSYSKSAFNFVHYDIADIALIARGTEVARYSPDFNNDLVLNQYYSMFRELRQLEDPIATISFAQFKKGFTLFVFNLNPDLDDGCSNHISLLARGPCRLETRFRTKLPNAITAILYCQFDSLIQIDAERNCITDF